MEDVKITGGESATEQLEPELGASSRRHTGVGDVSLVVREAVAREVKQRLVAQVRGLLKALEAPVECGTVECIDTVTKDGWSRLGSSVFM